MFKQTGTHGIYKDVTSLEQDQVHRVCFEVVNSTRSLKVRTRAFLQKSFPFRIKIDDLVKYL